ncbi:uncharacterized protein I303_103788 [Kwoniella dejecticola CBS 10117]|uniref:Major facilitator superfamily (MFS) profile domain-containing protein n=1 Tax=Kwoniella dejecticola CBS 10117 TaxID=1296121 RepID=A0A1A6A7Q3_9TREE|nr:uncharacterized protein I303_03806 [Kwoniella dejecticola CBS 10117]OBR86088.1 hypothetical protein I303_03806 [Kwoniella dejecticola CBS 10117]
MSRKAPNPVCNDDNLANKAHHDRRSTITSAQSHSHPNHRDNPIASSPLPPDTDINNDTGPSNEVHPSTEETAATELKLTQQVLITITVTLTTILTSSSGQILNIALPTIQEELEVSESNLQWIISSYNLSCGCLLLLSGRIADIYGRKRVMLLGMAIFTIFSLAGGFMQNAEGLIVSRALAGCGVAMSTPSTTGIIADLFTDKARSRVFACFSAGFSLGGILGLVIGGLFVSYVKYTWRSALFFVAGIGILSTISVIVVIPSDKSHTEDSQVDWPGAALITIGLVLFLFAISDAQSAPNGWRTSYIIALLVVGIVLTTAFFFWEHHVATRTEHLPLMRLALWTRANGKLAALYFTSFMIIMGFFPALYNATLFFQEVQQVGPVGTMLRFIPIEVSGIIASILIVLLIHRVPAYWLIIFGLLACGFGNMCFALSDGETSYWKLPFHGMWLVVFGVDLFLPTGLIFVSAYSLPDEYSVASGLFSTIQRLGASVGLALSSIISYSQYKHEIALSDSIKIPETQAYLTGLQASFWLSAGGCWFGALIAWVALRGLGVVGKDENDRQREMTEQATGDPDMGPGAGNGEEKQHNGKDLMRRQTHVDMAGEKRSEQVV